MRIVAGRFRGRALAAPADQRIRPTSDRVREAVFNILAHGCEGFDIEGANVIDLFAGTGALGLEALSRGARACLFVEEDAEARGLIRQNIEATPPTSARPATGSPTRSPSSIRPTARAWAKRRSPRPSPAAGCGRGH